MAYVEIGDYRYTDIGNGEARVQAIDKTKTLYEDNILSQVDIEGQTYEVTSMYTCFRDCANFNQLITIPNSVTNMNSCFYDCINFNQPIEIPKGVNGMIDCFNGCVNFNQPITIPSSVTSMSYCFNGCTNFNQSIEIPDSIENMYFCFGGCTNFNSSVTFSENARVTNMSYCFYNCNSFNQPIIIPNSVTSMSNCFRNCNSFNSLVTFEDNTSVTTMAHCFYSCTNFNQPIIIPNSVTSMSNCFYGCNNFNQPITILGSVENMQNCFAHCSNFNQPITIPNSVIYIHYCFQNCFALANNITIQGLPTTTWGIFNNTGLSIYIINEANPSITDQVATFWRQIASQYPNVHYELDDHPAPLIKLEAKRVDDDGRPDSTGRNVQITKTITIYQDFIPYGREPATKYSEILTINGTSVAVPDQSGRYLLGEDYAQKQTIVYTLNDKYREATTTIIVSRLIALLDFQGYGGRLYDDEPGLGMAIGKKAERNGLEINFPTAIGTGLTPATKFNYDEVEDPTGNPQEQGWYEEVSEEEYVLTEDTTIVSGKTYYTQGSEYVDLKNAQLIIGNYNIPKSNSVFIVGNGTENEPSNSLWIRPNGTLMFRNSDYADGVGSINAGLTFIDKNDRELGFLKAYAEEYNNKLYEGMTFGGHAKGQFNTLRLMRSSDGEYYVSLNGVTGNTAVSSNVGEAWRRALGLGPDNNVTFRSVSLSATGRGYYCVDKSNYSYPAIMDNGLNLWIGAAQRASRHHTGETLISSGHNGTSGNKTIYVSVPNAANDNATPYEILHTGFAPTSPTISISATLGTFVSASVRQFGKVVQLTIGVRNTNSIAGGSNIFTGTIDTTALRPIIATSGSGYYGNRAIVATISASGNITVRNSSTVAVSTTTTDSIIAYFTYMVP